MNIAWLTQKINDAVGTLTYGGHENLERNLAKLASILNSDPLTEISKSLKKDVDIDAWVAEGKSKMSGMVGSGRLKWPTTTKEEIGVTLALIDWFVEDSDRVIQFSHSFCFAKNYNEMIERVCKTAIEPGVKEYTDYLYTNLKPEKVNVKKADESPNISVKNRDIFVVHGHNVEMRETIARFLERIGFNPIILHEKANKGRTIIEKFEQHSDVGFAIVLLSPDDLGGKNEDDLKKRARQNVILELGYFIGKLGRSRVCALKMGDIELPSDILGIIWQSYAEDNGWKVSLAKELQAAEYDIDWNKVMNS